MRQFSDRSVPPVSDWAPAEQREIDMHIDRDGRWFYQGGEIRRERMVALFATILDFDGERYSLVTPHERLWISVERAPFVALLMDVQGSGRDAELWFTTNVGNRFMAGDEHAIWMARAPADEHPRPFVTVRDRLSALIARPVYYQLAEYACLHEGATGVWSGGVFFPLEAD